MALIDLTGCHRIILRLLVLNDTEKGKVPAQTGGHEDLEEAQASGPRLRRESLLYREGA